MSSTSGKRCRQSRSFVRTQFIIDIRRPTFDNMPIFNNTNKSSNSNNYWILVVIRLLRPRLDQGGHRPILVRVRMQ